MKQLFCKTITPIFSSADFPKHIALSPARFADEKKHYRPLECALFPGTEVMVNNEEEIAEVFVPSYEEGLFFTDRRLLTEVLQVRKFPSEMEVMGKMISCLGKQYVWGGNDPRGMIEFTHLYHTTDRYFEGVDCSGLLYYAYNGFLPRNTSQLATYGEEVSFAERAPLDICVWEGHVIVFLSKDIVIESIEGKGVICCGVEERLEKCGLFVVRRVFQTALESFLKSSNMVC